METKAFIPVFLAIVLVPSAVPRTSAQETPPARSGHSLINIAGNLYLFGGMLDGAAGRGHVLELPSNDLWKFDGENHDWMVVDPPDNLPPARAHHAAAAHNGKMYIFGGADGAFSAFTDIWSFDPAQGIWTRETWTGGYNPPDLYDHTAVADEYYFYLYGGKRSNGQTSGSIWRYNPATGAGTPYYPMGPGMLYGHAATMIDGKMYVFGGYGGPTDYDFQYRNDVWRYDPVSNTWSLQSTGGSQPVARKQSAIVASGSSFWVFGGEGEGGITFLDVWQFDLAGGDPSWTSRPPLNGPRTQAAAAPLGSRVVIFGGWDGQTSLSDTVIFRTTAAYPGDFNGDGTNDVALFRPSTGLWSIRNLTRLYFGSAGDTVVPGDYNGDGTSDPAIFRPSGGLWSVRNVTRLYFGSSDDQPVPTDYRGSRSWDPAIFRPTSGLWSVRDVTRLYFGSSGDNPVPSDYRGTGAAAPAVFRPASGLWSVRDVTRFYFGSSDDCPLPTDYRGQGTSDAAIFRPSGGLWSVRGITRFYFGASEDSPVPGDYRGIGAADPAVFRPSGGLWSVRNITRLYFGSTNDVPVTH